MLSVINKKTRGTEIRATWLAPYAVTLLRGTLTLVFMPAPGLPAADDEHPLGRWTHRAREPHSIVF